MFAPAETPRDIVLKINKEVTAILDDPVFREKFLAPQIFEPMASWPKAFADYIQAQKHKWSSLIREQHLTIQ